VVLLSSISRASQRTVDFAFLAPFAMCRRPLYAVWRRPSRLSGDDLRVVSERDAQLSPCLDLVAPQ